MQSPPFPRYLVPPRSKKWIATVLNMNFVKNSARQFIKSTMPSRTETKHFSYSRQAVYVAGTLHFHTNMLYTQNYKYSQFCWHVCFLNAYWLQRHWWTRERCLYNANFLKLVWAVISATTVRIQFLSDTTPCTSRSMCIYIQGVTGGTDQTSGGCSLC